MGETRFQLLVPPNAKAVLGEGGPTGRRGQGVLSDGDGEWALEKGWEEKVRGLVGRRVKICDGLEWRSLDLARRV